MATTQWTSFPHDMFLFNANQQQPTEISYGFPDTGSPSLKRRAGRIMKTSSTGTSPRTLGRRKTTAGYGTTRSRGTRDNHLQLPEGNGFHDGSSRPVSWHPSSFASIDHHQSPVTLPQQNMASNIQMHQPTNFTTASINGAVTPLSFPCSDDGLPTELFPTLDGYQPWNPANMYEGSQAAADCCYPPSSTTSWPHQSVNPHPQNQVQRTDQFNLHPGEAFGSSQYIPHYSAPQPLANTAPPTPDFLPIQGAFEDADQQPLDKDGKDELVGMGLYDPPDESPPYPGVPLEQYLYLTRLDGRGSMPDRPRGKGLKLEETFDPSTIEDADDDDDDDDEEDADQMSDEEGEGEMSRVETIRQTELARPPQMDLAEDTSSLSHHHAFFVDHDHGVPVMPHPYQPHPPHGGQWNGVPSGWI